MTGPVQVKDGHPNDRVRSVWGWAAPSMVWLASFAVYVEWAWRPALSLDEAAATVVVRSPWGPAWRMSVTDDAALGPYYLALKPWAAVSSSPLWLRLPSVIAAATAVTVLFVFLRTVVGARTAAATAAVLIILPSMAKFGHYARPYAIGQLACVLAVICWWDHLKRGRRRSAVGLTLALLVAGLAHSYALLIVGVLVLTLLIAPLSDRRRDLQRTVVPAVVAAVLLLPFLWNESTRASGSPNPLPITPRSVATAFVSMTMADGGGRRAGAFGALFLLLAVIGYVLGWRAGGDTRSLAVLAATWLVVPPASLVTLQAVLGMPGLVLRYWFFGVPAIAIGVGIALGALVQRHVVVMVLALVVLSGLSLPAHSRATQVDTFQGQRYVDLVTVMHLPQLESAPMVIQGIRYRGVLANDPGRAPSRFPLMVDGRRGPLQLVHPHPAGTGSDAFKAMVLESPVVLAFQMQPPGGPLLTRQSFTILRKPLAFYPVTVVTCDFYGNDEFGVFAQSPDDVPPIARHQLAHDIEAVNPAHIRCTAV